MQISVEKTSELNRKMLVSLPAQMLQEEMQNRFKSLAGKIKLDGFRTGKVPMHIIKKMYSKKVKAEATQNLIQKTYFEAIAKQNLNPAGHPHIKQSQKTTGFEYIAEFEIYPEIKLDNFAKLKIKQPVAVIKQADQDAMIAKIREQNKIWNTVDRAAKNGDILTINFSGMCAGKTCTDGKVKNFTLELGSKKILAEFDDKLIGLKAGTNKTFKITFPKNYVDKNLSGKIAEFTVELLTVKEYFLPEIDYKFIKKFGIEDGSKESFFAAVKANMESSLAEALNYKVKQAIMDAVYENMRIAIPNILVQQEIQRQAEHVKQQNSNEDAHDVPQDLIIEQSKRRVALGLVITSIIKQHNIKEDEDKVRAKITELASNYKNPKEVINIYNTDENNLKQVKQLVLENQAIEWIMSKAQVHVEHINFNQAMNNNIQPTISNETIK